MAKLNELFQSADFKAEKHVPVIEIRGLAKKGVLVELEVTVGKEIVHPNTTAHHIRWIAVYFQANGEKFPIELVRTEFNAHGEGSQGADTSTLYSLPQVNVRFKTDKAGTLMAAAYCNIHGLWQSESAVDLE